jgi:hypothetical protein
MSRPKLSIHRFRDRAGIAITGQGGGTLYLDAAAVAELTAAASALFYDMSGKTFAESEFETVEIEGETRA